MGENKKTLNIGSLIRSIRFIIKFIIKLPSLVTLMSFVVFRDLLGLENPFNGLVDELREGGRVLIQEWYYFDLILGCLPFFEHSNPLCGLKRFFINFLLSRVHFHLSNH